MTLKFFQILLFNFFISFILTKTSLNEILILEKLYNQTNGLNWLWKPFQGSKWSFNNLTYNNPCSSNKQYWQGIICSKSAIICENTNCNIISINLERYQLKNYINNINFNELSYLTKFDLSDNNINGLFPYLLPKSLLYLDLSDNQLSNSIPITIGELNKLTYLDLESNFLSSTLPSTIIKLTSLQYFSIYTNLFNGTIPMNIGSMISLQKIDFEDNLFTGSIPTSICNLKFLSYLDLSVNYYTSTLPSELGLLTNLIYFTIELNYFIGSIPSSIGSLTKLTHLTFEINLLSKNIPSNLGSLELLEIFTLYDNKITGSLPTEFGLLSSLTWLEISNNFITGKIPITLSLLPKLKTIAAFNNLFSSSLPCELNQLIDLDYLDLSYNQLTSICDGLILSTKLERLRLYHNNIIGTLPYNLTNNLINLHAFEIDHNYFSHKLPNSFSKLSRLGIINIGTNDFTGLLPESIGLLTQLIQFYAPNNHFSGSLNSLFIQSYNMSILNLDLSSNLFDGEIPSKLFYLPLQTLTLTSNCFHGTLPNTLCELNKIQVLSLDGLGSANNCKNHYSFLNKKIIFQNLIYGSIPKCLWNLKNLTILSLAGNGLSGSLASTIPSSLINLTLSHNHLTGFISENIQKHSFHQLDLSYNKLRGEFSHLHPYNSLSTSTSTLLFNFSQRIILIVNRLSGSFHKTINNNNKNNNQLYLNILTDNIFSCDYIPQEDINSLSYSCGSKILDEAFIGTSIAFFLIFPLFLFPIIISYLQMKNYKEMIPKWLLLNYYKLKDYLNVLDFIEINILSNELLQLSRSIKFLQYLERIVFITVILCIISPSSLYILRLIDNGTKYSTHTHLYRWNWTIAYFSGQLPAVLLIIAWIISITIFIYLIRKMKQKSFIIIPDDTRFSSFSDSIFSKSNVSQIWKQKLKEILEIFIILLINIITIGTINALYIVSTNQNRSSIIDFLIKISVAIFKVLWNTLYLPLLDGIKYSQRLKIVVRVLNSILIPCIATALSSPSCFQGLLVKSDPITSSYEFQSCAGLFSAPSGLICSSYVTLLINVSPFTPPFLYNYLCGSTLLAAYIPVYFYVYIIQLFIPILSSYIFSTYLPYNHLPLWIRVKLPGVLWPKYWQSRNLYQQTDNIIENNENYSFDNSIQRYSLQSGKGRPFPHTLLKMDNIMTSHMQDLLILLTFGLCCPFLSIIIGLSIYISIINVRGMIGRFVLIRHPNLSQYLISSESNNNNNNNSNNSNNNSFSNSRINSNKVYIPQSDIALIALTVVIEDLGKSYHHTLWIVVWSSCFFWSFLCWDIGGDEVGWRNSIWIPCLSIGYIILMRISIRLNIIWEEFKLKRKLNHFSNQNKLNNNYDNNDNDNNNVNSKNNNSDNNNSNSRDSSEVTINKISRINSLDKKIVQIGLTKLIDIENNESRLVNDDVRNCIHDRNSIEID